MSERENYYLLLGLDLKVDDAVTIQNRIQEKQREWALEKSQGNPAAQRKAARYLQLLDEIKATLGNDESRCLEAKDAQKRLEIARQAKSIELDDAIAVLKAAARSCPPDAIQKIVKQLAGSFSEPEVRARIQKAGIRLDDGQADGSGGSRSKERLDPVMAGSIKRNLELLNIPNLYVLLDRNPRSSPLSLRERADEINREIL